MDSVSVKETDTLDAGTLAVPKLLSKEEVQYFSQISSWRFFCAVAIEIFTIALTIYVSERYWNPLLYFLAVIIIGSRMHALAALMHDATHYRASSARWLNETIGELLAWPISVTMQGYRNNHFAHHRGLNTDKDPDWVRKLGAPEFVFPRSRKAILREAFQYAAGLKFYSEMKKIHGAKHIKVVPRRLKMIRAIFLLSILTSSILFGFWKGLFLYWVVPFVTSFMFFMQVRSVAEHFAVEYEHLLNHTRTVVAPLWERWLFAPHGINYHLEHHLYPSVPCFRLSELHHHLMDKEEYNSRAHITRGYTTGLFRECCAIASL